MMLYQSESKACFRLALLAWSHMALRCLCSHQKFGVPRILWTRLPLGMRKAVFIKLNLKNSRVITVFGESEIHSVVSNSLRPHGLYSPWNSPGQNTGVDSLSLLQGIFPTQESNLGLRHCRRILYQLSYQGSLLNFYLQLNLFKYFMVWGERNIYFSYKDISLNPKM